MPLKLILFTAEILITGLNPKAWRKDQIVNAIVQLGLKSLLIVTTATTFGGILISKTVGSHMLNALHTAEMMPGFICQFLVREICITTPCLLLAAKAGASMAAELGGMKVTEQLDAYKILGINPIAYLVFPRWIGCIISSVILAIFAIFFGVLWSMFICSYQYHISNYQFLHIMSQFVGVKDLLFGLSKAALYGGMIPIIGCYFGFECQKGAQGVGLAATHTVIVSELTIMITDFGLTYLYTNTQSH